MLIGLDNIPQHQILFVSKHHQILAAVPLLRQHYNVINFYKIVTILFNINN